MESSTAFLLLLHCLILYVCMRWLIYSYLSHDAVVMLLNESICISLIMLSFRVCFLFLKGSDIETLGLETELLAVPAVKEAELQDQQASLSNGKNPYYKQCLPGEINNS